MKTIIYIILIVLGSTLVLGGLTQSITKSFERRDKGMCEVWKKEAKLYPQYFITEWQEKQCDFYDIQIDAPVIK